MQNNSFDRNSPKSRKKKQKLSKNQDSIKNKYIEDLVDIDKSDISHHNKQIETSHDEDMAQPQEISKRSESYDLLIEKKVTFNFFKNKICEETRRALKDMSISVMTPIQLKTFPPLIAKSDLVGIAKTGSGKTLAFLVPSIEHIYKSNYNVNHGTRILIVTPTRELAIQIHGVLQQLLKYHNLTFGLVIGGVDRKKEAKQLSCGINILVGTPGRLLDHMHFTKSFDYSCLKCLVIDEADRILDFGFEEDMSQILRLLPKNRQTMLFSATQSERVQNLTAVALKENCVYIGLDNDEKTSTVEGLKQQFVICPREKRLILLQAIINAKCKNKKSMIFFSTTDSVEFHYKFFTRIMPNDNFMCIHGKRKQSSRTNTFFSFCEAKSAILLCTDVAARGLDIPEVDWIIQYDPPDDANEYIHRVGRTARGKGKTGNALIVLGPEESKFVEILAEAKVPIIEYQAPWSKLRDLQSVIESIVEQDNEIKLCANKAFKAYIQAYALRKMRDVFDIELLDIAKTGKTFGFNKPPLVHLNVNLKKRKRKLE